MLDTSGLRKLNGTSTPVPATPFAHRYAHAAQTVASHGSAATLNVWSPKVVPGDMSLSQLWVVGIDVASNNLQTVEAGWQVMSLWKTPSATTFVYSTDDNYVNTGCYATRCSSNIPPHPETFHLTSNKIVIGRPVATNGPNAVQEIKIFRDPATGDWWIAVDGEWVGFYPKTSFGPGPLSAEASYIDFGGETAGLTPTAEMGSGHYAEEGAGTAAYQNRIRYYNTQDQPRAATLDPIMSDAECYSVSINSPAAPDAGWGTYFFFGGPGTRHFQNGSGHAPAPEACRKQP